MDGDSHALGTQDSWTDTNSWIDWYSQTDVGLPDRCGTARQMWDNRTDVGQPDRHGTARRMGGQPDAGQVKTAHNNWAVG